MNLYLLHCLQSDGLDVHRCCCMLPNLILSYRRRCRLVFDEQFRDFTGAKQ